MSAYAAIRLKGHRRIRAPVRDTLTSLRLTRANHCVLLPATPDVKGQLQNAKDYITWGTLEAKEIANLLKVRGRLEGDKPLSDAAVATATQRYKTIDELAQALARGEVRLSAFAGLKPIFRLAPPRQGLKGGIKRSVGAHGNLGDRGPAIAELIARMI